MNSSLLKNLLSLRIFHEAATTSVKNIKYPDYFKLRSGIAATTSFHTTAFNDAARKGTRARREALKKTNKKKKLAEQERLKAIPLTQKQLLVKFGASLPRQIFSHKNLPPADDVYVSRFYQWKKYSIEEALNCHRESHHPTQYNAPDSPLNMFIELSLATDKNKRYIESVYGLLQLPHLFETGQERKIAVLTECMETRTKLLEMGCHLVGGKDLVKMILEGEININQYEYVIATIDIVPQLIPIRQLMKKLFPSAKNGTAVVNVEAAAHKFLTGLRFDAERNKYDPDYGSIEVIIGDLKMTNEQVSDNITYLLKTIDQFRGNRKTSQIITKAYLSCPPTSEKFTLDHETILEEDAHEEKVAAVAN